jgi:hypothetical protein
MADPIDAQTKSITGEPSKTVQLSEMEMSNNAEKQTEAAGPAHPTEDTPIDTTMTTATAPAAAELAATAEEPDHPQEPPAVPIKEEAPAADDALSISPSHPTSSPAVNDQSPVCNITLLLPTGARHPYKLSESYLAKRNVTVPEKTESGKLDPFSISVYTLKELILREWREEWDNKPASPSSIRLIHFGKLLEDKEQLNKYQFSRESPNVVHMSVRPAEMLEEEEAGKGKAGSTREGRRNRREGTSSNCCVIL